MSLSEENARKHRTDDLAGELLALDDRKMVRLARSLTKLIVADPENRPLCICVSGGAGSGKSTLAKALSKDLLIPTFDLDEYIEGGWTQDQKEYDRRFMKALYSLWQALPAKKGWIIEHVEAGNPYMLEAFKPSYLIRLDASQEHLRRVAGARALAAGEKSPSARVERALSTNALSKQQYTNASGDPLGKGPGGCSIKALTKG